METVKKFTDFINEWTQTGTDNYEDVKREQQEGKHEINAEDRVQKFLADLDSLRYVNPSVDAEYQELIPAALKFIFDVYLHFPSEEDDVAYASVNKNGNFEISLNLTSDIDEGPVITARGLGDYHGAVDGITLEIQKDNRFTIYLDFFLSNEDFGDLNDQWLHPMLDSIPEEEVETLMNYFESFRAEHMSE